MTIFNQLKCRIRHDDQIIEIQ